MEKKFNIYSSIINKQLTTVDGKGVIVVEGYASKSYEGGRPVIDSDREHVDTKGFNLSNAKILLAQHDWDRPIGKLALSHKADGIWIKAEVHEAMDAKTFYAVKEGILDSFSIGFTVTDWDFINVDGEDIVSFKSGSVHEVSIVSIPANTKATINSVDTIKSMIKDGECTSLQCSIKSLKQMNPDCECLKSYENKKNIEEVIKGLTFQETEMERWNEYDKFNLYLNLLRETLEDNFYAAMWYDGITPEEVKQNILNAFVAFNSKLSEFNTLSPQTVETGIKSLKGNEDMKIEKKEAEVVQTTKVEGQDTPDSLEEETSEQVVEETVVEGKEEVSESVEDKVETVEENTTVTENKQEIPVEESDSGDLKNQVSEQKPNIQTLLGTLATLNYGDLSAEEIEALYNMASDQLENIEAYAKTELSGDDE